MAPPNRWAAFWLLLPLLACPSAKSAAAEFMFRAVVNDQVLEGKPLSWNAEQVLLLGRDGRLHDFHPALAKEARKTSPSFVPCSANEMRAALQQEFGQQFDISTTSHYVVVHPRGQQTQWASRFEQLYHRFQHYFRVRGCPLTEPAFPLVAIVFRDEADYFRHAEASGAPLQPGTLGHYDPLSNRVFLFDLTQTAHATDWSENAATIIHEATHQTAYNVGIHQRFAAQPRWLVEGLASMFEARGVWNGRSTDTQADRVNRERLAGFRDYVARRRQPDSLLTLLSTDQAFRSEPDGAYAEAWALSFYLCETQPRSYAELLGRAAARPSFSDYPPAERLADFQEIFGRDLKLFDQKFLRYMAELK